MEDLRIGSSIFNSIGASVGTLFTRQTISIKADGKLNQNLKVSNLGLAPGSYYSGFSIGRGGQNGVRNDFDIVMGSHLSKFCPFQRTGITYLIGISAGGTSYSTMRY